MFVPRSFIVCSAALLCSAPLGGTQAHAAGQLNWMRDYAIAYTDGSSSPTPAKVREQLNLAPRFLPALRAAFPQRQWFWKDHGRFWSVAEVASVFLGVPGRSWDFGGSAWLDEDRYITQEGCVPHDCFDRGMLWVDTRAATPSLIFTLTQTVPDTPSGNTHIWIFTSNKQLGDTPPAAYQRSVGRWFNANQVQGYKEDVLLVTVVTPDGQQRDEDFMEIAGKTAATGARQ